MVALFALACLLWLCPRVDVRCNDDTFVYFNYARNVVAGNGIVYDQRMIRSEGVTSLLYLFLLLPFEAAGANMMFVAVVFGLLCVPLTVACAVLLLRADRLLPAHGTGLFALCFLAAMGLDSNVTLVIGRGLETMLGPAMVLVALLCGFWAVEADRGTRSQHAWSAGFMAAVFVACLVRPENALPLGLCGLLLLRWHPRRSIFLLHGGALVLATAGFLAWKWWYFGDILPTGYYRKVARAELSGSYLAAAAQHYAVELILAAAAGVALYAWARLRPREGGVARSRVLSLLAVAAIGSLLLGFRIEPLIGYGHRFVVNSYMILHLFSALAAVHVADIVISRCAREQKRGIVFGVVTLTTCLLLVGPALMRAAPDLNPFSALLREANEDVAAHPYLRLGRHLKGHLPEHEAVTLVFGDAGCIPYAAECTFVDVNGLTEPFVARLFAESDREVRQARFADYVMSWDPDIVVLAWAEVDAEGRWRDNGNRHSPFRRPAPRVFQSYREHGVVYLCSLRCAYDLHIGVRPGSPHFESVARVLLDYCSEAGGYILPTGLKVLSGGAEIAFPPLTSAATRESRN